MLIKRHIILNGSPTVGLVITESRGGEWVRFEDVKKLVIKLTQGREWNGTSIEPIEGEECFIMFSDGMTKPALMSRGKWTKLAGYPHLFDVKRSDVIKWRYAEMEG